MIIYSSLGGVLLYLVYGYCLEFIIKEKNDKDDRRKYIIIGGSVVIVIVYTIILQLGVLRFIYDEACDEVDKFCEGKNFCCFKNGVCRNKVKNGCCRKCFHLTDKGCPTRNLACKLFFCSKVTDKHKVLLFDDLKILYALPFRCRIIVRF